VDIAAGKPPGIKCVKYYQSATTKKKEFQVMAFNVYVSMWHLMNAMLNVFYLWNVQA